MSKGERLSEAETEREGVTEKERMRPSDGARGNEIESGREGMRLRVKGNATESETL